MTIAAVVAPTAAIAPASANPWPRKSSRRPSRTMPAASPTTGRRSRIASIPAAIPGPGAGDPGLRRCPPRGRLAGCRPRAAGSSIRTRSIRSSTGEVDGGRHRLPVPAPHPEWSRGCGGPAVAPVGQGASMSGVDSPEGSQARTPAPVPRWAHHRPLARWRRLRQRGDLGTWSARARRPRGESV